VYVHHNFSGAGNFEYAMVAVSKQENILSLLKFIQHYLINNVIEALNSVWCGVAQYGAT
jgi:hypothetical protein